MIIEWEEIITLKILQYKSGKNISTETLGNRDILDLAEKHRKRSQEVWLMWTWSSFPYKAWFT
jgi:hypothetical protein